MVPNFDIIPKISETNGKLCEIPKINRKSTQRIQTLKENSFKINGPMLFNSLPKEIRNISKCSVEDFKFKLDGFLTRVPDQPKTANLVPEAFNQFSAKPSNSIIDQVRRMRINAGG